MSYKPWLSFGGPGLHCPCLSVLSFAAQQLCTCVNCGKVAVPLPYTRGRKFSLAEVWRLACHAGTVGSSVSSSTWDVLASITAGCLGPFPQPLLDQLGPPSILETGPAWMKFTIMEGRSFSLKCQVQVLLVAATHRRHQTKDGAIRKLEAGALHVFPGLCTPVSDGCHEKADAPLRGPRCPSQHH